MDLATATKEDLVEILTTAATVAGEKITGNTLKKDHIAHVVEMIVKEQGMVTWMTMDERKAMEMELGYRDHRIEELEAQVVGLEKKVRNYEVQEGKKGD
jgi:hypothetical protein